MGELVITAPGGKVTKILINTEAAEHVVDGIIKQHLDYWAPTEEHVVDFVELY